MIIMKLLKQKANNNFMILLIICSCMLRKALVNEVLVKKSIKDNNR